MPTYDFRCKQCKSKFERFVSLTEFDNVQLCECGGESIRLISGCSFVYEGSEHRPIDCIVGKDAEKRWEKVYERKEKRKKKKLKEVMK